ncbi:hypothetical protein F8M41_013630 [Gigaspora margarita]|uniref:Uncharacterized protein n=1 Tax=Gigaspora margarita TaxID=4874 RepID=A0A8H3WZN4_GIGMA|nr:hypothetical protein F8M41_013630 [Gigaspora margarita]
MSDLYFNGKLGFKIDKEKGEKYLRLAAENGYEDAITLCKKNKINFINKHNYFKNFEVALGFHNSRTVNNRQEVEKINCKLFDKLYKKKYYELDSSGQVAYWIGKYFIKGYGTDKKPTKDDINNYKVLLKLAVDKNLPNAQHDYAVLFFTNGSKEECFKYLIKAKDQNYLPSIYLLGKLYYDEGKYLLKKASKLGNKEATELWSKINNIH